MLVERDRALGLSVGMAAMATPQSLDLRSLSESIAFFKGAFG
jgi:hypothetical protein